MKRILGIFSDFINFGHQVRVCEKRPVFNISCNSKIYGICINLGCRFEFRTQKLAHKRNSGNFSFFINSAHHAKKKHFSILAVFQNVWDLHKFGLQIWIPNTKITLWKNFVQFFRFHRFWSSGPGMQKKGNFPVLVVFRNIWDLHKFGLQIWIQNAKITLWKNFVQFIPISSILVIRSGYAKKDHFPVLAVFQNIWDLHKYGLQIWIQNVKITL